MSWNQPTWMSNVRLAKHLPNTKPQIYKCRRERHFFLYIVCMCSRILSNDYSNIGPIMDDRNNY